MDKSISNTISTLRLPLAIMVVFIHGKLTLSDWSITSIDINNLCPADVYSFIVISLSETISAIAVPVFFYISGYLFFANFRKWDSKVWCSKMKSRIHTLLIPYLLWSILSFIMILIGGVLTHHGADNFISFWDKNGGVQSLIWFLEVCNGVNWLGNPVYVAFPIVIPLWFMRDLMVMSLLTPILYILLTSKLSGVILSIICLAYISGIFPYFHFVTIIAIFMFSAGSWMALHCVNWVDLSCKCFRACVVLSSLLFVVAIIYSGNNRIRCVVMPLFVLSFAVTVIALSSKITRNGRVLANTCKRYAPATFFLYVFHGHVLTILARINDKFITTSFNVSDYLNVEFVNNHLLLILIIYFGRIAIAIMVSIVIFNIIDKYFPRLSKLMCGGK